MGENEPKTLCAPWVCCPCSCRPDINFKSTSFANRILAKSQDGRVPVGDMDGRLRRGGLDALIRVCLRCMDGKVTCIRQGVANEV